MANNNRVAGDNTRYTSDNTVSNTSVNGLARTKKYTPDAEVLRARAAADPLNHATTLADQIDRLGKEKLQRGMSGAQAAAQAWYACNGDLEHRHTTGVYVRQGRGPQAAPVLGVYVDTHACLNDFSMRKDIYLTRLAFAGFEVSGIEFRLSRQEYIDRRAPRPKADAPSNDRPLLAPLTHEEKNAARTIAAGLAPTVPEELKSRVSRVVELSLSREKARERQK